jgi:hypothetical protein
MIALSVSHRPCVFLDVAPRPGRPYRGTAMSPSLRTIAVLGLLAVTGAPRAATYFVNTTDVDLPDTNTALAGCDANPVLVGDQCTLRAAIMQANASAGPHTIVLPLNATIALTLNGIGGAESGDLDITQPMTITGALLGLPANLNELPRVEATFAERLFDIGQNVAVTFRGLRMADGAPTGGAGTNGGALRITAGSADVLVDRVRFLNNIAATGGAISNSGTLVIEGSDFVANLATTGGSAIQTNASGHTTLRGSSVREIRNEGVTREGLRVLQGGTLILENSYVDGTQSMGTPPTAGIRADRPALLAVRNSTLVDFSERALDLVADGSTTLRVYNSILAGSGQTDCTLSVVAGPPPVLAFEWNLVQQNGCGAAVGASNQVGFPALLGSIENVSNHFFRVRRPVFGSRAIDLGAPSDAAGSDPLRLCTTADLYATPRPLDGDADGAPRCDMGAVETSTLTSSTYVVNTYDQDLVDLNPGDNRCDANLIAAGDQCTLRAAVMEANAKPGPDRIEFTGPLQDVNLTLAGNGGASTGDLDVFEALVIEGEATNASPRTRVSPPPAARIFDVDLPAGQVFALRRLSLSGGDVLETGGALRVRSAALTEIERMRFRVNHADGGGGAVAVETGQLRIRDTDFWDNSAGGGGAALLSEATSTELERVSVRFNEGTDPTDRSAVVMRGGSSAIVRASTVHANSGGMRIDGVAQAEIQASTITDSQQYGLRFDAGPGPMTVTVRASVVTGNTAGDCVNAGVFATVVAAYNALGAPSGFCAPFGSGSIVVADPLLAPALRRPDNSYSFMRFPLTGSPLIDAIPGDAGPLLCAGQDQRGLARPIDSDANGSARCEIGSVELTAAEAAPREFVVERTSDHVDGNSGDGICNAPGTGGFCTLRAAMMEAAALPGPDRVTIPASAQPYVLAIAPDGGPSDGTRGALRIVDEVTVSGPEGPPALRPTIQATTGDRHFNVISGEHPVRIENLRLTGGSTSAVGGGFGGSIALSGSDAVELRRLEFHGNSSLIGGGALAAVLSATVVEDSDFHGNSTGGSGAAIYASAMLTLRRVSVRGNVDDGPASEREAILIDNDGLLELENATISGNTGNGIRVVDGSLLVRNSTLAANTAPAIEFNRLDGRNLLVHNSALTGNLFGACTLVGAGNAGIATDGYNLSQGSGCNLQLGTTNIVQASAVLGPLVVSADEFTTYHVPLAGSALRDAAHPDISALGCTATDQRGAARPVDGDGNGIARCDIGAIEASTAANELFRDGFE